DGNGFVQAPGKSHARKLTAAMAMPTPKSTPARIRFEPPSPKAKVKPATTIETSDRPRAIVVVNACIKTLTAFSHGEAPVAWANAADARISEQEKVTNAGRSQRETNLFRRIFFIGGEFLSGDARRARIGTSRQRLAGSPCKSGEGAVVGGAASRREVAPSVEFRRFAVSGVARLAAIPIRGGRAV